MIIEQIEGVREKTPIGTKVQMLKEFEEGEQEWGRIIEKYKYVFVVRTNKGRIRCFQWLDILLRDRVRMYGR